MSPDWYLDHERQVPLRQLYIWVIFWPKRDAYIIPLHHPSWLDMLSQADLTLELLSLCLRDNGHATLEDHVHLSDLFVVIRINPALLTSMGFLRHQRC
jgi:hypothetical protein